jgi:two-component system response regulator MprA
MSAAILVVDDERAIGIAIQRLLSRRGYEVETALSGEDAVEKLASGSYQLVITDLNLKVSPAWRCCGRRRSGTRTVR